MLNRYLCGLLLLVLTLPVQAEIYRYQDEQGRWVYTDKPPPTQGEVEQVKLGNRKPTAHAPTMTQQRVDGKYTIRVNNIFHGPIQVYLKASNYSDQPLVQMLKAQEQRTLIESSRPLGEVEFYWFIGPPKPTLGEQRYQFPVTHYRPSHISQSFHGAFSHYQRPNLFAVDIATELGADVVAARDGTVVWVKDDYHLGAASSFFIDKANYLYVLHSDGSYAVYAHILKGSAKVKAGDQVRAGQLLAKIGNSGYSTGPHLHFVIWHNAGLSTRSLAFKFLTENGTVFTPEAGDDVLH